MLSDDPYLLGRPISDGEIAVCVVPKTSFVYTDTLASLADAEATVARRYYMIDKDNLPKVYKDNPQMLKVYKAFQRRSRSGLINLSCDFLHIAIRCSNCSCVSASSRTRQSRAFDVPAVLPI